MQGTQEADEPLDGGRSVRGWRFPRPGRLTYGKVSALGSERPCLTMTCAKRTNGRELFNIACKVVSQETLSRVFPRRTNTGAIQAQYRLG